MFSNYSRYYCYCSYIVWAFARIGVAKVINSSITPLQKKTHITNHCIKLSCHFHKQTKIILMLRCVHCQIRQMKMRQYRILFEWKLSPYRYHCSLEADQEHQILPVEES